MLLSLESCWSPNYWPHVHSVFKGKTSKRFILRLVKWTSTFFTVIRLRVMMTHIYDASYDDNYVSLFVIKPLICSFTAHSCFVCLLVHCSLRVSKEWLRTPLRHLVIRKQRLQCHMGRKQVLAHLLSLSNTLSLWVNYICAMLVLAY